MKGKRAKPLAPEVSVRVIDALGGTGLVAEFCSVTKSAVSLWKRKGIPPAQIRFLREKFKRFPIMKDEAIQRM